MSSFFSCSCNLQISAQVAQLSTAMLHFPSSRRVQQPLLDVKCLKTELSPQRVLYNRRKGGIRWSFLGGSRVILQEQVENVNNHRKGSTVSACWLANSQIASSAFTLGTVAVLPFYTLMVAAPNARITKRTMESTVPYVMLGVLYAYLLYISWTPDTLRLMFASKYWLPELPGITRMFSNELTAASAWIHLLTVDLFAARQVYHDGIKNKVETRHSVSLCLLFCPIGIATHAITKFLQKPSGESH